MRLSIIKRGVLVVALTFVFIMLLTLTGCSKKTQVNVNDYIKIKYSGVEGYGSIAVEFDFEAFVAEKAKAMSLNEETKYHLLDVFSYYKPFVAKYEESSSLSNGDVVKITWERNKKAINEINKSLHANFESDDFEITVNELPPIVDFDPFDELKVEFENPLSGFATVKYRIEFVDADNKIIWDVAHDGENGKLKNGDEITLKITSDIDIDKFAVATGKRIARTECKIVIDNLCEPIINGDGLNSISEANMRSFNNVMKEWVVGGLNDENVNCDTRTFSCVGWILYTNNNENTKIDELQDSMLVGVYHVVDDFVPDGYFVYIGLKGSLSYNYEGIKLDGQQLPDEFMYFEKQTVRYSEKFGWSEGDEDMGFLCNDTAYAGNRTIKETVEYLDSSFGSQYKYRYNDALLNDSIDSYTK